MWWFCLVTTVNVGEVDGHMAKNWWFPRVTTVHLGQTHNHMEKW